MPDSKQLVSRVNFIPGFDTSVLKVNESGYLQLPNPDQYPTSRIRLLGFARIVNKSGMVDTAEVVRPITDFSDLLGWQQTVAALKWGVGPRLHNRPPARGTAGNDQISAYTFDLDPNEPHLAQVAVQSSVAESTRLFYLKQQVRRRGMAVAIADLHARYGEADAVLVTGTIPFGGASDEAPRIIIPRSKDSLLHRVGTLAY